MKWKNRFLKNKLNLITNFSLASMKAVAHIKKLKISFDRKDSSEENAKPYIKHFKKVIVKHRAA